MLLLNKWQNVSNPHMASTLFQDFGHSKISGPGPGPRWPVRESGPDDEDGSLDHIINNGIV